MDETLGERGATIVGGCCETGPEHIAEIEAFLAEHRPKKPKRSVVLIGKGVTFDSGGISIKPSAEMDKMRYDKCGGTTVIGAMKAVADLKIDPGKLNPHTD